MVVWIGQLLLTRWDFKFSVGDSLESSRIQFASPRQTRHRTVLSALAWRCEFGIIWHSHIQAISLAASDITNCATNQLTSVDRPCSSVCIHQTDAGSSPWTTSEHCICARELFCNAQQQHPYHKSVSACISHSIMYMPVACSPPETHIEHMPYQTWSNHINIKKKDERLIDRVVVLRPTWRKTGHFGSFHKPISWFGMEKN